MDMLIIIGIIALCVLLTIGYKYGIKKGYFTTNDIKFCSQILNLSLDTLKELGLVKDPKAKMISEIIYASINYVNSRTDENINKLELSLNYCYGLCQKAGIELTDERKSLIKQILELSLETSDKVIK